MVGQVSKPQRARKTQMVNDLGTPELPDVVPLSLSGRLREGEQMPPERLRAPRNLRLVLRSSRSRRDGARTNTTLSRNFVRLPNSLLGLIAGAPNVRVISR